MPTIAAVAGLLPHSHVWRRQGQPHADTRGTSRLPRLGSPSGDAFVCMQQPPQMSRHKGGWALTTAKVLSHLRNVSQCAERTATDQEQAAINQVWGYVEVGMHEYEIGGDGQWKNIAPERREGVRQRLRDGFIDDAFLPGGGGHEARKRFKRADLLKWGDRLLAAAAAHATGPAVTTDDDSTGPITVISPTLAGLPEATRLIVEDIMERAAAAGYELRTGTSLSITHTTRCTSRPLANSAQWMQPGIRSSRRRCLTTRRSMTIYPSS